MIKLIMKNSLTSIEDCEWTKKELELIFSTNQIYSILMSIIKKKFTQLYCHIFFSQIHTAW